ncbi:hypothetical protein [Liquorilactobacillus sicerae]|uniref:hypothetical protein n=1 Tax=Liquorilactobacillus sicerae TaxID=1416943 RepID=UPI00248046EA|nr:hypothetical protein [Liquorilactobacillus sicerae]
MKIKVADFIHQVENEDYQEKVLSQIKMTKTAERSVVLQLTQKLVEQFEKMLAKQRLSRLEQPLDLNGQTVSILLETGIINLPFANVNHIDNFFELESQTDVIINLIVIADKINASGLRIDSCGLVSEVKQNQQSLVQKIAATLETNLQQILENSLETEN